MSPAEESFNELANGMRSKDPHLNRALANLGEHYDGVVILVHCFDPVSQVSVSRYVTQGDPLAARQSAQKFLRELEWQDEVQFNMHINRNRRPPTNEDNNPS